MRSIRVVVVVAILGSVGVAGCAEPGPGTVAEARVYQRLNPLFTNVSECRVTPGAQPPCFQTLDFCLDGTVKMVLTDVPGHGRYAVSDAAVDVHIEYGIDQGDRTFTVLAPDALQAADLGAPFDRALQGTAACAF